MQYVKVLWTTFTLSNNEREESTDESVKYMKEHVCGL